MDVMFYIYFVTKINNLIVIVIVISFFAIIGPI